ncbi:MAG TPA: hypothetical protein VG867_02375 [Rhizomicrobium sp.]|nr:hypothetical protein [Rhizomicrobium sp.]
MQKIWRMAPLAIALLPGTAFAAAAQYPAFKLPSNVAVDVSGGRDGGGVQGTTSVGVRSPVADTTISGTFSSQPPDPSVPAERMDRKLDLDSKISVPPGVDITVQASSETNDSRQTGLLAPAGLLSASATTKTDTATAKAETQPLAGVGVTMGVSQTHAETTQDNVPMGGAAQSSAVSTDDRKAFASANWSPLPFLQVKAGAASETMNVSSRGAAKAADEYRYTEPYASATAQLWDGAHVKVSGADTVTPVNPYDFAALVQAAGPDSDLRVTPNREWRNQAGVTQNFDNGIALSATVTQARIESATELGFTPDGTVAPMSVSGGERRELDASLSMPLSGLGLPDTTISSQATLRRSHVRDPVTGQMRRASGEIPREAGVKVTHDDDAHHLEWGVTGNLATAQNFYQPAQVTALQTDSGVGAFITYKPGKYVVSLNASGLIGGARSQTDTFYLGSRAGNIESVNRTSDSSPLVSLSVSQKF